MATTKKTTKKVTRKPKALTPEEKILGVQPEIVTETNIDYESPERWYRVTSLLVENATPSTFNGTRIETFIGYKNAVARNALINGAKEVITVDGNDKEAYKIEVI